MQTIFPPSDLYNWVSRIYEPGSRLLLTEYSFPVSVGALLLNGQTSVNVQMTQNADFVLCGIDAYLDGGGSGNSTLLVITDSATGEQFSNAPTPLIALATIVNPGGGNSLARNLPYPKWVSGISTLTLTFSAETATGVTGSSFGVNLRGFQIRKLG